MCARVCVRVRVCVCACVGACVCVEGCGMVLVGGVDIILVAWLCGVGGKNT